MLCLMEPRLAQMDHGTACGIRSRVVIVALSVAVVHRGVLAETEPVSLALAMLYRTSYVSMLPYWAAFGCGSLSK